MKFTKSQFNAMTNDIVRLAREFTDKGFDSPVSFAKESLTLFIHDSEGCACLITLSNDRYVWRKEFEELENAANRADVTLDRRYVSMMGDAVHKLSSTWKDYVEF